MPLFHFAATPTLAGAPLSTIREEAVIGKAAAVKGTLVRIAGRSHLPVNAGDPLRSGDRLEMGDEGSAILLLTQNGVRVALKLAPGTRLKIQSAGEDGVEANLESGSAMASVRNVNKVPHAFRLRTRTAVIGIRGTVFFAKVAKDSNPDFFCPCSGEITVTGLDGESMEFSSKHHDKPVTFAQGKGPLHERMKAAPMGTEHTDGDAKELNAIIREAEKT